MNSPSNSVNKAMYVWRTKNIFYLPVSLQILDFDKAVQSSYNLAINMLKNRHFHGTPDSAIYNGYQ